MPSERAVNPAQAHRKAEKAKALKKSKAQLAAQRAEKLARRNPARLERQIEALVEEEGKAGSLRPKDKQTLETLRKDVAAIKRAREKLGIRGDDRGFVGDGDGGVAGKKRKWSGDGGGTGDRRRDGGDRRGWKEFEGRGKRMGLSEDDGSDSGFSTDESVRRIPMPRDTPPPVPAAQRRSKHHHHCNGRGRAVTEEARGGDTDGRTPAIAKGLTRDGEAASVPQAKTVYEAAPAVRDLRKEATSKFIPSAVKGKLDLAQGKGRLLEEDEVVLLSKSGYVKNSRNPMEKVQTSQAPTDLDDEEKRFQSELSNIAGPEVASRVASVEDAENV